jgi:hypothetical protein
MVIRRSPSVGGTAQEPTTTGVHRQEPFDVGIGSTPLGADDRNDVGIACPTRP